MRIILLLLVFLLPNTWASYGQSLEMKFDHITPKEGLPHSTVHGIAKDKYGFMWFGTWSGICRYDGYKFKVYRYDASNPRSIVNSRIHNILRDEEDNLWILTFDETYICRYNYETDDFDRIRRTDVSEDFLYRLTRRNHLMNISFSYKAYKWHLDTFTNSVIETHTPSGSQRSYTTNPIDMWSINDSYVSDLYLDSQKILWLGTYSNGISKSYLDANPFHYWYHDPNNRNSIIENTIRSICEDKEGNLWIGTRKKGITLIKKNGQFENFIHQPANPNSIQSNYIKKIYCDSQGIVWIGSQKGLDKFDPVNRKIIRINDNRLYDLAIYGFVEDIHRNIWIASWNGIFKYDRKQDKLFHLNPETTLARRFVWTIAKDSKGQIWAGTEGGGATVLRETADGKIIRVLQLKQSNQPNSLSDGKVYHIFEDSDKKVWIATGNGLDLFDPVSGRIENLSNRYKEIPKGTISGVTEDQLGYIWVSHKKGISRIDKNTFQIRTFSKHDGLQSNEFAEGAIYRSDRNNILYFGGNNGINAFSPDSIKIDKTIPPVVLTELQILNNPVEVREQVNGRVLLTKPLYLTKSLDLIHDDKSFSIEFAALHFTNPEGNKYAYMLEGFDKDWIYTDASQRVAYYANLQPGKYSFKVKASNSDGAWTPEPIAIAIHVAPPWWFSIWAYIIYSILILLLLLSTYYYLVRYAKLKNKLDYEAILHEKERELHQNKVDFFTNISHEIKTPLTLILSPIQQLSKLHWDSPYVAKQLDAMQKNGDRLFKIVNQLLDIRRLESGHDNLRLEQKDMIKELTDCIEPFKELAAAKGISLQIHHQEAAVLLWYDSDKIEKVINNLLSNAVKFTNPHGKIQVKTFLKSPENSDYFTIQVIDDGVGIAPDVIHAIFTPFNQSKINNPSGSGLGLAYAKSLVELHGGTITANSTSGTADSNQTLFEIQLPTIIDIPSYTDTASRPQQQEELQSVDTLQDERQSSIQTVVDTSAEPATLLILEDNTELREYLSSYFAQSYQVIEASNGVEGLKLANLHIPDLIISDVMMPEMDGITFCSHVKESTVLGHIPVILLTARSLVEYEIEGLQTGADDYLTKPFNLDVLALKVKNQLQIRLRLQEKFKQKVTLIPSTIETTSPDDLLLQKIMHYVEENITNSDLKIESICTTVGMSRTQLYRKMKTLTGYTVADMIREIRLQRAQQLLRENKFNINEITYMVGFTDADYFRKCFKNKFGDAPSEYAKKHQQG